MNEDLEKLLAKAVEGDLRRKESEVLLARCRENPELRNRLVRLLRVERLMGVAIEDGEAFLREFQFRMRTEDAGFASRVAERLKRGKVVKALAAWSAVAAVVLLGVLLVVDRGEHRVGSIVKVEASDWSGESGHFMAGDRIRFESGLMELHFDAGVVVVLEGPADFEVKGQKMAYLHQGKLVAEVEDQKAHGFVIDGPSGRLVDLGTKFAVSVAAKGEMEVHVMDGVINVTTTGGATSRLLKNQAMRLSRGEAVRMPVDLGKFVTRMPDYLDQPVRSVWWSFDESDGPRVLNVGSGLSDGQADGRLRSFSAQGNRPKRIAGKFGRALEFDGIDSYVETDYRGVIGSGPRTVTLWVRVPEDFDPLQGYGIVNWGNIRVPGGAWQISINGIPVDGPVGKLRIGTHWGQVIGTTDLRDGQWHHCAVVMYGDEEGKPNTATHILLYVDGKLEPAARRSVQPVNTVLPDPGRTDPGGIWIGRNLGFEKSDSPSGSLYGRFFRGAIDEMAIFDVALDQKHIISLMEINRLGQ